MSRAQRSPITWLRAHLGGSRSVAWLASHRLGVAMGVTLALGLLAGRWSKGDDTGADGPPGHDPHCAAPTAAEAEAQVWTCSMHPQIRMPGPGSCPICGMDLIVVSAAGTGSEGSANTVVLSDRAKALARVETVEVARRGSSSEIRLLAKLEPDETRVRTITPWVDGRIDRLYVSAVGEVIRRGQPVASMYSPDVYAAQTDLLTARTQLDRLGNALPVAQAAAKSTYEAAKTRLKLLGVSPGEVERMAGDDSARRNVAVISNYTGTVIEQFVHEGAYVQAGTPIYKIADLSLLWAQLDAYEDDLPRIEVGGTVSLEVSSYPGEPFDGVVAFIDPVVDPRTRTARVRVQVANPDGRLRVGMFADAVVHAPEPSGTEPPLTIPVSAPLFTGTRSIVYVELPDADAPTYEPRPVRLGPRLGDRYPVIAGLREGERVVTRGAFAIDADLQIKGGASMMTMSDDLSRERVAPVEVPESFRAGLRPFVEGYLAIGRSLGADDLEAARRAFGDTLDALGGFDPSAPAAALAAWKALSLPLRERLATGRDAQDIAAARAAFEAASESLIVAVRRFGNPLSAPLRLAFCPMAFGGKGAFWLQEPAEIDNPYFGAAMRRCGEIREVASPGAHLAGEGEARPTGDEAGSGKGSAR